MQIKKDEETLKKIYSILDQKEINISVADFLLDLFNNSFLENPTIENIFSEYNFTKNEKKLVKSRINSINCVSKSIIKNNPYINKISLPSINIKGYSFGYDAYNKFELFSNDDISIGENYINKYDLGYFDEKIKIPCLRKDNDIWMSVTPNEIHTMEKAISRANGNVLVFGLGIGYFPFMISLKDNVEDITIVENDKIIIQIFNEYILKQFNHPEKIHVIEMDALEYLKGLTKTFDYAFIDIWHNPVDGLPYYINFQKRSNKLPKDTDYWLETSLIDMLRRYYLTIIEESLAGYSDKDYEYERSLSDKIINAIYYATKNTLISKSEDVDLILDDKELIKLVRKLLI